MPLDEKNTKKISLGTLKLGLYKIPSSKGFFLDVDFDGVVHHFFIHHKPDAHGCVIFGTGAVNKRKVTIPYFDRLKWYEKIPCTTIYYFDSTLFLNEKVNLGWLYGTNQRWYLKEVEQILRYLLKKMKISTTDTVFVGSSGGGFTSCVLATFLKSKALVYNPQLICKNWSKPHIAALESVLKENEELIDERINLNLIIRNAQYCPMLHIVQNVVAQEDLLNQIAPFVSDLPEEYHLGNRVRFDFYANEKGHNGMVDNDKTIEMIIRELSDI